MLIYQIVPKKALVAQKLVYTFTRMYWIYDIEFKCIVNVYKAALEMIDLIIVSIFTIL